MTSATLNYISEVGFVCKPQTTARRSGNGFSGDTANQIIDPNTGVWYHTEIFDAELANGFIPLDASVGGLRRRHRRRSPCH